MKKIGAYEAKTHLSELLKKVAAGQSFTITNRGEAVAFLTPVKVVDQDKIKSAVQNIKNFRKSLGAKVDSTTLRSWMNEGRD